MLSSTPLLGRVNPFHILSQLIILRPVSGKPPHKYYEQWLEYTEAAYDVFLKRCSEAGPPYCPLAEKEHEDPLTIRGRIEAFLDGLYDNPISISNPDSPGILTAGLARKYLFVTLESQLFRKHNAAQLAKVMNGGDASELAGSIWDFYSDLERSGVSCNDQPSKYLSEHPPSNEDIVDTMLHISKHVTKLAWGVVTTEPDSGCYHWGRYIPEPPERFTGPWNHTLLNPLLVLSSTVG